MLFSQTTEYALRAMVWLAQSHPDPQTTQEIAEVAQVPAGYLSKVMQALGRARLVQASRGLHGGFTLAKSPADMTILDVVNAVDPIRRIQECPLKLEAHSVFLCPLHKRLDDAVAMIEAAFRGTTLAELVGSPAASRPLCNVGWTAGAGGRP
jgi:Rrf2 family nitric oxide-sensitive transcriptional repressor